jgi:DNA polymerase III alpha subunit
MKDILIGRQIIIDNSSKIIKSAGGDPSQMELFAEESISTVNMTVKEVPSYIEILEKERDTNGIILTADYLKGTEFIKDVLQVKPISELDLLEYENLVYGVCVDKQVHMSNKKTRIYKIFIADSTRRVEVMVFNYDVATRFEIGELYIVNLRTKDKYKPVIFLDRTVKVVDGNYNIFIKKPLFLKINTDIYKNNIGLARELTDYINMISDNANEKNSVKTIFINQNDVLGRKREIAFDNNIYKILTNYFNIKISLK